MRIPFLFHFRTVAGHRRRLIEAFAALAAGALLFPAQPLVAADSEAPVTRAEYEALMKKLGQLQQEVTELKSAQGKVLQAAAAVPANPQPPTGGAGSPKTFEALRGDVEDVHSLVEFVNPGSTRFVMAGSASASFNSLTNTASNFGATFSPIFLWELNEKLLVESELEFQLEDNVTTVNLEYVDIAYQLNDYMTIVAGKFLNPMNIFVERYEPKWINKLPDAPLAIYDGILPESNVGIQVRGAVPFGVSRLKYAAYASNAPVLQNGSDNAGQLEFANYSSATSNKAFGGRVAIQAIPGVEAGYGMQYSQVSSPDGGNSPNAFLQSVDVEIKRNSPALKGAFTLLGQYAWSNVGSHTYGTGGTNGFGPLSFSNFRDGGYVQLSYRPKQFSDWFNRFEFITRLDMANAPANAPGGFDERRLTLGLDYWLTSYTVLKLAYELDRRTNNEPNQSGVILQLATGL